MKYLIKLFSILVLVAMLAPSAEAQIFKKLKKKAQKALEEKAEQKIDDEMQKAADQMVEESWDAIFGGMADLVEGDGESKVPFSMNSSATTEEVYSFDVITTMQIQSGSEPPLYMDMHFNENAQYTGTTYRGGAMDNTKGDIFLIYDFENAAMVMLMNSDGRKFSFAYDWTEALSYADEATDEQDPDDIDWEEVDEWNGYTKIGSRTIAGYDCEGYRSENQEGTGMVEVWVTRDDDFGMANMFKANANAKQLKSKIPEDYPYGMMVEMTTVDTNGNETKMQITKVQKNANVRYAMADYPNMGNMKK